jgi:antitoxin ChpS
MPTIMKVRRQGGARIVTLPSSLLDRIGADVGTSLALDGRDGAIVATPVSEPARRRYTLDELPEGAEHLLDLDARTAGALDDPSVGDEIG